MDHWEVLLKEGQPLLFRKGQVIFYEGHQPYGLFVLKEGNVHFTHGNCSCDEEHQWASPKGLVLGLRPFFDGSAFNCTCTANENCRAVFISKTQLMQLFQTDNNLEIKA